MMLPGMANELDRREAETDKRDREDDPTPRPLVRALLGKAMPYVPRWQGKWADRGDTPAVLLRRAPAVLLFHQTTSFQRGRKGVAAWRAYPPARVWLVPGSVGFRGPGSQTDSRCYQGSLWLRGHAGPTVYEMLGDPPDGGASWRWTVLPGSEEPCEDLPGVVGWTP